MIAIGVDIGGTKVLAAVVDSAGRVLDTEATATPGRGQGAEDATAAEVEDALVDVAGRLLAVHGRCPVGRSFPSGAWHDSVDRTTISSGSQNLLALAWT